MGISKIKVCFLIPSLSSGGIETYLLRFLNHQKENISATVLVRNSKVGELLDSYKATGAEIIIKPLGYFSPSGMHFYYKLFKEQNFDTVCDFNANFAGIPMLLAKLAGVKKRITFYRQGSDHFKKSKAKAIYNSLVNRLVFRYSTAIFANSAAGLEFFFPKEFPDDSRFKVIKNGVTVADYINSNSSKEQLRNNLDLPENKFLIGHTGRFTPAKNHNFLLYVAKGLIDHDQNIHIVLIGNDTQELHPLIDELGIAANCTVLGFKSNIPDYLKAFDLYFFPSLTEGQPNALIEAMMTGLAIVASDIPSIRECLPAAANHCLIDPYNVNSAVDRILKAKENPESYIFQDFAVENFDAKQRFDEFRKTL